VNKAERDEADRRRGKVMIGGSGDEVENNKREVRW